MQNHLGKEVWIVIYNKNMSEIKNTEREPRSCIYRLLVNRNSNPEICRAISLYIYIYIFGILAMGITLKFQHTFTEKKGHQDTVWLG